MRVVPAEFLPSERLPRQDRANRKTAVDSDCSTGSGLHSPLWGEAWAYGGVFDVAGFGKKVDLCAWENCTARNVRLVRTRFPRSGFGMSQQETRS